MWMQSLDSIAYTRSAYEYIWHTLNLEEKLLQEALVRCYFNAAHGWPVRYALQLYQHAGIKVKQRIADVNAFYAGWGSQKTITDDQHVQSLADASAIFGHLKLEWWPGRGTVACHRKGKLMLSTTILISCGLAISPTLAKDPGLHSPDVAGTTLGDLYWWVLIQERSCIGKGQCPRRHADVHKGKPERRPRHCHLHHRGLCPICPEVLLTQRAGSRLLGLS